MNRTLLCVSAAAMTCAAVMTGCASGNDPLNALGSPGASFEGTMLLPYGTINGTVVNPISYTPYSVAAGVDGMEFNYSVAGSVTLVAPVAGLVTATDNVTTVSLTQNFHVTTRLTRMSSVSVRVGDYIPAGGIVGTTSLSGAGNQVAVRFAVLVDGVTVCPYSFLTDTVKGTVNLTSRLSGNGPCNP
jgi:hypothetical protein